MSLSHLPGVSSVSMNGPRRIKDSGPTSDPVLNKESFFQGKHRKMGHDAIEQDRRDDPGSSLIQRFDASEDLHKRTGTTWTAVAHIIAAVIGAGVLSLAWSVAQLGWILGPLCIIVFALITLISSALLADCYRYPDPEYGPIRNRSFMDAAKLYLGKKQQLIIGVMAQVGLYGGVVAYTVTAASSVRAILKSNCHHREGHNAPCEYENSLYMLLFGLIQILVSQTPDFNSMGWLSVSAAVMSFLYSLIGFGLGLAKVIENGTIKGSITGAPGYGPYSKLSAAFTALGDIAFSYPFSLILLEIEDTLKTSPPENKTMKAASATAVSITTIFYLCCGCVGYAAFGADTPGNLLAGFSFSEPYWLVGFANACIVLHLIGGYQMYTQAVFATTERWFADKYPDSRLLDKSYTVKFPLLSSLRTNLFRLTFRTTYVASATAVAILFPYFNSVIGVLGAMNFWPLAVYFPVEMYCVQMKVVAWSREWILLRAFSIVGLVISIVGTIGSVEELISAKFN